MVIPAVSAKSTALWDVKITIHHNNAPLSRIISDIEQKSGFSIIVRLNDVDIKERYSIDETDMSVDQVLSSLFRGKEIGFELEGEAISVFRAKNPQPNPNSAPQAPQPRRITGTVVDAAGDAIIGATVAVAGTNTASITDGAGAFSLPVPESAVLVVGFYGYITQEINVGPGQTVVNITLQEDSQMLDDVVVVGFGTQKKANLTGAVSTIKGEDMINRPLANTASMLQGQVPGLQVIQSTGQPGEENVSFRIRGYGSFSTAGTAPLVLINGIEGDISRLDPNMIDNISVLKDAASAAIYGARAANGVILVTTKQGGGSDGKPVISYNGVVSFHNPIKMYDLVTNSVEYMELFNIARQNSTGDMYPADVIDLYRNPTDKEKYPNFDWMDYMLNTALMQTHNLSLAGQTEKTTYNISLSYLDQEGTLRGHSFERLNFTTDLSAWATKWMRVGMFNNMSYGKRMKTRQDQQDAFLSSLSQAPTYKPWLPDDGSGVRKWTYTAYDWEDHNKNMPAIIAEGIMAPQKSYEVNSNIWTDIKFLDYFTWHTKAAARLFSTKTSDWRGAPTPVYNYHTGESNATLDKGGTGYSVTENRTFSTTLYSTLTFDWSSANQLHNVMAMAGYSQETFMTESLNAARREYPFDLKTINAGGTTGWTNSGDTSEWALQSLFGRVTYNYKERYLFEANARYDGSSRLSPGGRWGLFPSFSAAWRLSEEEFFKNGSISTWLNYIKIRGSWGQLGNQNIGTYPYQAMIAHGTADAYAFDKSTFVPGYIQTAFNNEHIKWETVTETDFGVDLQLFNRLGITVDWYNKVTSNILRASQVSWQLGMTAPTVNSGKIGNRGIEVAIDWNDQIRSGALRGLRYYAGVSLDHFKNELLDFGADEISGYRLRRKGLPWETFYMLDAIGIFADENEIKNSPKQFSDNTLPGDIKYRDIDGYGPDGKLTGKPDGKIDNADRTTMSGAYPALLYTVKFGGQWKGIDLSVFGTGVHDVKFYVTDWGVYPFRQGSAPTREYLAGMWTPEKPNNARFPRLYFGDYGGTKNTRNNDHFLQNASYFRIKNITLGYTLPKPWTDHIGISRLRVYASLDNMITFTKFYGALDPERTSHGWGPTYPQNKSVTFGINLQF